MKILKEPVESEIEIKKSKFITFLFPVKDEAIITTLIDDIKSKHPKANHFCTAYILTELNIARFDDDHEPLHTAGKPMLNVLTQQNVDQVLAVTVRYFGGIKLGAGGLIRAYTKAVALALSNATYQDSKEITYVVFSCLNQYASQVEAYCYHVGELVESSYNHTSSTFKVKLNHEDHLIPRLESLTRGSVIIHNVTKHLE
jgi:uncharacterized YigZ family protein